MELQDGSRVIAKEGESFTGGFVLNKG